MMFYNRRLFRKRESRVSPSTYGAYLAAGEKVVTHRYEGGTTDVWMGDRDVRPIWWQRLFDFYPFYIAASGGRTLLTAGRPSFGDSSAAGVFAFFRECYGRKYFPRTYFQGGDPFLLEKKATHFSGTLGGGGDTQIRAADGFRGGPGPGPRRSQGTRLHVR
jgi:multiple sugar transport system substrate-binding protein